MQRKIIRKNYEKCIKISIRINERVKFSKVWQIGCFKTKKIIPFWRWEVFHIYIYIYIYICIHIYIYIFRRICWKAIDKDEPARYINIADIYDLALGCNTTDIMKKHNIPNGIILLYVYIYIKLYINIYKYI